MRSLNKNEVLIINNRPQKSGIGRYTSELVKALARLSLSVSLYQWEGEYYNFLFNKTIEKGNFFTLCFEEALRVISLGKFMLKVPNNFPLYHITNPSLVLISIYREPTVVTVHDLISFIETRPLTDRLVKWVMNMLRYSNSIICVSKSTEKDLLRFIDVDPKKIRVIYYGVDHELFKPRDKLEARRRLGLPLDRPIILNVGSEEPRKNIPILLKSFKELLNSIPNALLVRVGEKTAYIEKLINSLGLNDKVLYRRASPNEVALYYNAADLLCFPSYYEGFGNPPLEAMASGLPVIAGNRTSIPEVVSDAGILLDPFDVEGFAYWMREVLMNEDLRNKLSEAGYKRSMNFSWEKCARETLEVYREILNEA
jgi:glycosyltransferase involved in cell wall biosynthesis